MPKTNLQKSSAVAGSEPRHDGATPAIDVVGAVIRDGGRVLLAQRPEGKAQAGLWEFPGGKIEPGETPEEALKREIREELDTEIEVGSLIRTIDYDYPTFHLTLHCFLCTVKSGSLRLNEHEAAKWLRADELYSVDWLPADLIILPQIHALLQ